jgi:hypothetical protein
MRFKVKDRVLYIGGEKLGSEGQPLLVSAIQSLGGYDLETDNGAHFVGITDADLVSDTPTQRRASAARVASLRQAAVAHRSIRRNRLAQIKIEQQNLDKRYRADEEALTAERRALEIEDSLLDPKESSAPKRSPAKRRS